jgi:hypothetical protein
MELDFGQIIAAFGSQVAQQLQTDNPNADRYVHAIGRLMAHAGRWRAVSAMGIGCSTHFRNPTGERAKCSESAISGCVICAQPVCLTHSMVSTRDGTAVCFGCVGKAQALHKAEHGHPPPPATESEQRVSYAAERRARLQALGLGEGATDVEVHAAFKALAFEKHPDRASKGRKKAAEKEMAKINEAYSWLVNNKRAAA